MKTIVADAWNEYREKVIPKDAGPVQLKECRRAFYAGANGLFVGILNILEPGEDATENDLAQMDSVHQEFVQFSADVKMGKA